MWECEICQTTFSIWAAVCSNCGSWRSLVPAAVPTPTQPGIVKPRTRGSLLTAQELAGHDRPSMPLSTKWRDLLGSVPQQFGLQCWGPAGAGKSSLLLCFAQDLTRIGEVVYCASEEGQGSSMIEKLSRLEIRSPRIHVSSAVSFEELVADLNRVPGARFAFVDSLSCFPASVVQISELAEERRLGIAYSLHETKSGAYVGKTTLGHWVDISIRVGEDKVVEVVKNRFGPLKQVPLSDLI